MKVLAIDAFKVDLPFRFAFGHSLASRASSSNLIVKITLDDGTQGYGEGIPRDYVTGEDIDTALAAVKYTYSPRFIGLDVASLDEVTLFLEQQFESLGLQSKSRGASWCALELAVLDAVSKAQGLSVSQWLGPPVSEAVRYGAVVPFGGKKALLAILAFYKLYGFDTVKVKVGSNLEDEFARLSLVRSIMGPKATLRLDANCAWTVDETLRAAERLRPLRIASYEQPVTAGDTEGLVRLTALLPEPVIVDESLCTLEQAQALARAKACSGFNIRISKVGGLIAAQKMVEIASRSGIRCHMGAQVGESGILSAAGRVFACINEPFDNYEGSDNAFLLKHDLTRENLTVGWKGYGKLTSGLGLGVTVDNRWLSGRTDKANTGARLQATTPSSE